MKNFEGSVNLTFEIYCMDSVTSFYSSENKFICLDFLRVRPKLMKYSIFNIQILAFSIGHIMENFECSVNLTFEICCKNPVTSFYSSKNKFIPLDFLEGLFQTYEILHLQYPNIVIFQRPYNGKF